MSVVTLASGGLDSTLLASLIRDEGIEQFPLFIDYGQRARDQELAASRAAMRRLGLPEPEVADLAGYGRLVPSGLTDSGLDVFEDVFLPGRNLLFVLTGAAYACRRGADTVALGLLNESTRLFPDQSRSFIRRAQSLMSFILDRPIRLLTPLMAFSKEEVVRLAQQHGITGTYSCHAGGPVPCGVCVSCREFQFEEG